MNTALTSGKIFIAPGQFAWGVLFNEKEIVAVGSQAEIEALIRPEDRIIDVQGRTVLPGLIDTHLHLYNKGCMIENIDLRQARSIQELIASSRAYVQAHPNLQVIRGRGWNHDYFSDQRLPDRHDLDQITDQIPMILTRACGHIACVNTAALKVLNFLENVPQLAGGCLDTDAQGRPTGIVRENAMNLLSPLDPPLTLSAVRSRLKQAADTAASMGLTSVHTNDFDEEHHEIIIQAYQQLHDAGELNVRIYLQCCLPKMELLEAFVKKGYYTGKGDDVFKIGPLKLLTDGSLGARTAWMRKPYADDPATCGIPTHTHKQVRELLTYAHQHGLQTACHAIGDAAIEMVLDAIEAVNVNEDGNPKRHGIVHCQITDAGLLQRFADLQAYAYVQPIFLHYDQHIAAARVSSPLAETSYAFKTMAELGVPVSFGTDCPVEDLNPFENLYCAITRKDLDHPERKGFVPAEGFDLNEAILHATAEAARFSFEEDRKGQIQVGWLPDFTICDADLFALKPEAIKDVRPWMTICQGRITYWAE